MNDGTDIDLVAPVPQRRNLLDLPYQSPTPREDEQEWVPRCTNALSFRSFPGILVLALLAYVLMQ